ncbi:hypothetical protein RCH14_003275 [Massilia sp. MP_M2]
METAVETLIEVAPDAPSTTPSKACTLDASLPLWNPRAATCLGLLLSPVFSAYIHMCNWDTLGEDDQSLEARAWCCMLLGYFVTFGVLLGVSDIVGRNLTPPFSATIGLLAGWHVWGGRGQERYVAVITGGAYTRRPWRGVILAALAMLAVLVVMVAAVVRVVRG